jgi:hypothetical protein
MGIVKTNQTGQIISIHVYSFVAKSEILILGGIT